MDFKEKCQSFLDKTSAAAETVSKTIRSPKALSVLKFCIAIIGAVHAYDELRNAAASKKKIGFDKN